jgi:P-type Ca2+ transporter type 2C
LLGVGDNKDTAEAICKAIGVFAPGDDLSEVSMTGRVFSRMPPDAQRAALGSGRALCISRAEPRDKQDIVRQLKAMHEARLCLAAYSVMPALLLSCFTIAVAKNYAVTCRAVGSNVPLRRC